ncbi:interferon regulatory factor 7 isoform X3 [Anolis carolinensis]|uniref:interferon regulatory factor 7 isoform X3 n=1 Tax=Anolis carolinensis TaxID=28377 RepID=UPI000462B516|nr:PREDICTED: interferon regulatory factor 7 isoform X3 [Anolis carolinensis]|eukprot:XP_008106770.1 PREDICTED: interferon regulatory factor 7 isoform X3 [Anolis carolinensis]
MAAAANRNNPQKICFFDWLVNEINSREYWLDEAHTIFCIPWKHNSRKDIVADDYRIFKEWAVVSKKYNEHQPDPSKWKTNFRCALNSTKKFKELKSNNPDYHVYRIISHNAAHAANLPADRRNDGDHENDMLRISPSSEGVQGSDQTTPPLQEINIAFEMLSLENPVPGLNVNTDENVYQCSSDTLQWVMQQANMNMDEIQTVSWAPSPSDHPIGEVAYQQNNTYAVPHVDQTGYHHLRNRAVNETVENRYYEEPSKWLPEITTDVVHQSTATLAVQQAQQNSPAPNQLNHLVADALGNESCFIENMFMDEDPLAKGVMMCNAASQHTMLEQSPCPLPVAPPVEQPPAQTTLLQNDSGMHPLNLGVSIYYRGSLLNELRVTAGSCLFTYNNNHTAQVLGNPQIIQFPNPQMLPDQKQVTLTLTALQKAGLLLYQKNCRLWARRLGPCNVFWAFSKQLENIAQYPEHRLLQREVDTEIFNFEHYFQGLQQFYDGQRSSCPDYTIYLCFGQRFSAAKPKESKLILVKLVPELCKHWHERVLREGVSSLNSEIESLQFSNSLFDMMEYLTSICRPADEEH